MATIPSTKKSHFGHRKLWVTLGVLVALLVGFRLYLPTLVARFVNRKLNEIPGYQGHIDGVRIHLWRGAYTIEAPQLSKREGKIERPFIEAKDIDLSVNWNALIHGALVAKFEFDQLRVNLIAGPSSDKQQMGIDPKAMDKLRSLFPLRIDKLVINDGEVHYGNPWGKPPFDIHLDEIQAVARNLTNSEKISKTLVATLAIKGRAMKSGSFNVDATIDPYAKEPTFELALALRELSLPELNAFFKDKLAVRATDGHLGVWAEVSSKHGAIHGYVKPLVQGLEVVHIKDEASVGETLKGVAVEVVTAVFRNRPHQQIGAKVEFKGSLEKPDYSIWDTVVSVLSNAFVKALEPKLDEDTAKNADQANKPANDNDKSSKKLKESAQKTKAEVKKKAAKAQGRAPNG